MMRALRSMAHDDERLYEMAKARAGMADDDLPEYPGGLCFCVREADFQALGIEDPRPGATVKFAAFARATSVNRSSDGCRIEAEIDMLSIDGSEMAELDDGMRPSISLDETDHEKLDLDDDCQRGDMLHIIGMARVETTSDTEYGGRMVQFQITEAAVEDEDMEARDVG